MRATHRVLVVGAVMLLSFPFPVAGAQAQWRSFTATATADGLRVAVVLPGGPLNDRLMDGASPRSRALLDRLGTSSAYAAGAYPDELVLNVPGLGSGITGAPIPEYPLIAASSHPTTADDEVTAPGIRLRARSGATHSMATGETESEAAGKAVTTATVSERAGTLTASATATMESLTIGPLTLGRVVSSAAATRTPTGEVQRSSELVVSGARVGDESIDLPAGEGAAQALAEHGVDVTYIQPDETRHGVTAAGLSVTVALPVTLAGDGESTATYMLGRATASVEGTADPVAAELPAMPDQSADGAPDPATGELGDHFLAGGDAGLGRELSGDLPPADGADANAVTAPMPLAAPAGATAAVTALAELWRMTFYAVLVAGAVATTGTTVAFRKWGVRRLWDS